MNALDEARTTLRNTRVAFCPRCRELDARMRGRLIHRITLYDSFHPDDTAHDEGVVIFCGWQVWWRMYEIDGVFILEIWMGDDLYRSAK
ncbi:hypothetical protein [Rhodopseudomonas palustris]|uniref:hypothetical protein n=1 Tax=Rhodopseudomonas palustris TaxID=1076 RepID=UPI000D202E7A|nr:hypothetical protein [Rhodopseudomonas palustris]AVT83684.1 hypothetical protein RPYSC3_48240 [Rhodopseudomonas palustris]